MTEIKSIAKAGSTFWRCFYTELVSEELSASAGSDPNAREEYGGSTPLLEACSRGHVEAVRLLLSSGADPDLADNDHRSTSCVTELSRNASHDPNAWFLFVAHTTVVVILMLVIDPVMACFP